MARSSYERLTGVDDLLVRATELSVQTMIFDVEPLVAFWDSSQESLDDGVALILSQVKVIPAVRVVVFATNSARRPSAIPAVQGVRVKYLASAGKPLRIGPYRDLPRPGAVIGDQVPTDGILARRLGYTFLYYRPGLSGVPIGPRLMHHSGRLVLPLLFKRRGDPNSFRPPRSQTLSALYAGCSLAS
jgi:predicted HAD superfamily phosphohydrolase YqeG